MEKAVFFDRDGIVNHEVGDYIQKVEDFMVLDSFIEFLKVTQHEGYLAIIITNQAGIAKGLYTHETVAQMHKLLNKRLSDEGLKIDAIYYCPHHDDFGKCLCRKPGSLMVEKALARFNIDPQQSLMFGDKQRDKICAEAAGVKGYVFEPNPTFDELMNAFNHFKNE
jgi:D-glycero-D-manno-heptose 1,7-bisphosphate phosphatase